MTNARFDKLVTLLFSLPWLDITAELWQLTRKLWRGLADEGMYEVLDYTSTLELHDKRGHKATYRKQQRVRYRQNNIIAYQDQAWGDGQILLNYRCSPGREVDRYRRGYKTHILISLRGEKQRGDEDEFIIEWDLLDGFPTDREHHEVEISHRTKNVRIEVIFPSTRPPLKVCLLEQLRRRVHQLPPGAVVQLPDGRWRAWWETHHPRLNEHYLLQWEW